MKNLITILLPIALLGAACNNEPKEKEGTPPPIFYDPGSGKVDMGKTNRDVEIPIDKRITWAFTLPNGYNAMSDSEVLALDQKGREAIERMTGQTSNDPNRTVYAAKLDDQNSILVTKGPYSAQEHGLSFAYMQDIENAALETYRANGIPFNFNRTKIDIDGLVFRKLDITLFRDAAKTQPMLYQTVFTRIIENTILAITHSYNRRFEGINAQKSITSSTFR